jgi:hypothetical protein
MLPSLLDPKVGSQWLKPKTPNSKNQEPRTKNQEPWILFLDCAISGRWDLVLGFWFLNA